MFLSRLHLRDFRNFVEQTLELPPQGVVIVGDNGQGKTNLLESICYLEIFRSFRGASDEQLVRVGEDAFRIVGGVGESESGTGAREIAAAFDRRGRRKKVTLDGAEPPRMGDAIGQIGVAIFSPSDVAIVAGSPGGRRRFLDIILSLSVPGYLSDLQRYRQVLSQRNALLRRGALPALVSAWDQGLISAGSRIIAARSSWIRERRDSFAAHTAAIAGGEPALLFYEPSVEPEAYGTPEAVAVAFAEKLERTAEREQRRGITVVGPHRDDLRLALGQNGSGELDLRVYGSGGQQRTAAIALRMTEAETIRDARGEEPILLLDDVFAELDPGRSARIREWIERRKGGQIILTAPKPTDWGGQNGLLPQWQISGGTVRFL